MLDKILASLDGKNAPSSEFWKNELEMHLDHILVVYEGEDDFLETWGRKLTGRQVDVLEAGKGTKGALSTRAKKKRLQNGDGLFPYFLVDRFGKYKSKVATVDFAERVLDETKFEA